MPVQFDEQNFAQMQNSTFGQPKGLSAKLINWGIAKDQKSANVVLIVVLVVTLVLTLFLMFSGGDSVVTIDDIPFEERVDNFRP